MDEEQIYIDHSQLIQMRHPYETIPKDEQTKKIQHILAYTYFHDPNRKRIYRKSPVSPWMEKYLRYDDAEYLDILRYNTN